MPDPKDSLCFALDVSSASEAVHLVERLAPVVGVFKVGLQLFLREGPPLLHAIRAKGARRIFLDLKFLDIPRTVHQARRSTARLSVDFVTVHCECFASPPPPREVGAPGDDLPKLLGVTLLTSIGPHELEVLGYRPDLTVREIVLLRAELARNAGCAGVVCAGNEVEAVRERMGPDFLIVTPGIRPMWTPVSGDDQNRTRTAREAIAAGADMLVVGRPIRLAPDPPQAARRILEDIELGMRDRAPTRATVSPLRPLPRR